MLKSTLLIMSFVCVSIVNAQNNSEYNFAQYMSTIPFDYMPVKHKIVKPSEKISYEVFKPKKGTAKKYVKIFDADGNMINFSGFNEKNKVISEVKTDYENGQLKNYTSYKKGKLQTTIHYQWNDAGDLIFFETLNKKNKITTKNTWTYNQDGCVAQSKTFKKGGEKLHRQWDYEYFSECTKSKSTLLNGKGKILKEWTFDCKDEGEVLEKKKNTNQICKWEEVDKDYLIYVQETFDEKGKIIKFISKVNRADSSLVEYKKFDSKNQLLYHATYLNDREKPIFSKSYHKGKVLSNNEYKYENNQVVYHKSSYKKRYTYTTKYAYNEDGNVTALERFNKKDELIKSTTITY
ncbi:hypothetical protein [Crocinitomix catalasitica]|uniref:hypothetical protein n=1 Tax=Crocinitomix catalasitica TaxID=184607 RepID=UPI0012FA6C24|nr:hypothetical protein [Crocinitomix catalasitica]